VTNGRDDVSMSKPWGRGIVIVAAAISTVVVVSTIMICTDPSFPTAPWQAKGVAGFCLAVFWLLVAFSWWVAATGNEEVIAQGVWA
jgi:hypothetical protein